MHPSRGLGRSLVMSTGVGDAVHSDTLHPLGALPEVVVYFKRTETGTENEKHRQRHREGGGERERERETETQKQSETETAIKGEA